MQITDLSGEAVTVTDLQKAIRQARFFKNLANDNNDKIYSSYRWTVAYWNDMYIKLRQLQQPALKLFNYQLRPCGQAIPWEGIRPVGHLMPDRQAASRLAKKVACIYKAEVRLTQGPEPEKANDSYFR